jgi:Ran GTPase-activating protein (RanGAP) involved in mRNA processing and transport
MKVDLSGLDDDAAELEVDLSKLNLTDSDLNKLLPEMPAVTALDLSGNRINDTGLQTLVATCVARPELKLVKLQGNAFGELGRTMLAGLKALRPDLEVSVSTGPDPAPPRVWANTQS